MFGRLKFWQPQNFPFKAKTYAASKESNIELLMLALDFMVNYTVKTTHKDISVECIECFTKDAKKRTDLVYQG